MKIFMCPLIIISLLVTAAAQFTYPPPLTSPQTLNQYTSGALSPPATLNFSSGDNLFGEWTTPIGLNSFLLYRCAHTPSTNVIYPSNSTFNSTAGFVASDGTWQSMPLYTNGIFPNGFISGSNPFLSGDFFVGNQTTGSLCWFELYPGHDEQVSDGKGGSTRHATVSGNGPWYFASVPFVVKPKRDSGLVLTWFNGTPVPKIGDLGASLTSLTSGLLTSATKAANTATATGKNSVPSHFVGSPLVWVGVVGLIVRSLVA